jgi:purine-binding chemotaxis protein CheW
MLKQSWEMTSQVDYLKRSQERNGASDSEEIKQLLTFTLNNRYFCLELEKIKEIRAYTAPTELPSSLDFVSGVINIRGIVVPIYDLRKRFNLPAEENKVGGAQKVIIVVNLDGQDIGILVDSVSDIIYEEKDDIKHSSSTEVSIKGEFINGIVISNDKVIVLLAVEKLFGEKAIKEFRNLTGN